MGISIRKVLFMLKYSIYIKSNIETLSHSYCYINIDVSVKSKLLIRSPYVFFYFWYGDHFFPYAISLRSTYFDIHRYENDKSQKYFNINVLTKCSFYKIKMDYCTSRLQLVQYAEVSRQYYIVNLYYMILRKLWAIFHIEKSIFQKASTEGNFIIIFLKINLHISQTYIPSFVYHT